MALNMAVFLRCCHSVFTVELHHEQEKHHHNQHYHLHPAVIYILLQRNLVAVSEAIALTIEHGSATQNNIHAHHACTIGCASMYKSSFLWSSYVFFVDLTLISAGW